MKTKFVQFIPMVFIAATSLGGCSSGLGSADTYDLDVTVNTKGVSISLWTGFGENVKKVLEPILEEFSAKTGIKVKHESKGGYPNLQTAINLSATRKAYANIALGYPDHFAGYITSNIQLRLDGLIENDHKRAVTTDENGISYDKDGLMCLNYEDFYEDYREENEKLEFNEEGKPYILGVPFNKSSEVMCYNAEFFEWCAKQDDLKDSIFIPKTWAEVKSVGLAVKELFKNKKAYGRILCDDGGVYDSVPTGKKAVIDLIAVPSVDEFRFFSYDSTENMFITLIRQYGSVYTEVDTEKTGVGYAAFNDPEHRAATLEAMAMLRDLWNNGLIGIASTFNEQQYCSTPFKKGQSLLNVGSTGGLTNVVGTTFTTKAAPIPVKDLEHKFVISQGTNLALFNKGNEKQIVAAWKLMVYLSQQANGAFCGNKNSGYFPTCEYAKNSEEYQEYLEQDLSGAALLQQEAAAINSSDYEEYTRFVDPGFRGSSSIRTEVGYIPGYIFSNSFGGNDQAILDDVYVTLSDHVRE